MGKTRSHPPPAHGRPVQRWRWPGAELRLFAECAGRANACEVLPDALSKTGGWTAAAGVGGLSPSPQTVMLSCCLTSALFAATLHLPPAVAPTATWTLQPDGSQLASPLCDGGCRSGCSPWLFAVFADRKHSATAHVSCLRRCRATRWADGAMFD